MIFRDRFEAADNWLIRTGVVADNHWPWFVYVGMVLGIAIVRSNMLGWIGFVLSSSLVGYLLWKDRRPQINQQIANVKDKIDLSVNMQWSNDEGFTACSQVYYENHLELQRYRALGPIPYALEAYARSLRERDRLIAEGHVGKSFRYDASKSAVGSKIRVMKGFFAIEKSVGLTEYNPPWLELANDS